MLYLQNEVALIGEIEVERIIEQRSEMCHFCAHDIAARVCSLLCKAVFGSRNLSQITNMKFLLLLRLVSGTFNLYDNRVAHNVYGMNNHIISEFGWSLGPERSLS